MFVLAAGTLVIRKIFHNTQYRYIHKLCHIINLAQIIRMLEEIGTGGAGFRFMYGAYLQQAAQITGEDQLKEFSQRITMIGDKWRAFASDAAAIFKRRKEAVTYADVAQQIAEIGKLERAFFTDLGSVAKGIKL